MCIAKTPQGFGETGLGATWNSLEIEEGIIWPENITKSMGGRER